MSFMWLLCGCCVVVVWLLCVTTYQEPNPSQVRAHARAGAAYGALAAVCRSSWLTRWAPSQDMSWDATSVESSPWKQLNMARSLMVEDSLADEMRYASLPRGGHTEPS